MLGYEFCVWVLLGTGTATLKFRQLVSALCDAFWGVWLEMGFWGVCCCLNVGVLSGHDGGVETES